MEGRDRRESKGGGEGREWKRGKGKKGSGGERTEEMGVMHLSDTLFVSHGCPQSLNELPSLRNLMTDHRNR